MVGLLCIFHGSEFHIYAHLSIDMCKAFLVFSLKHLILQDIIGHFIYNFNCYSLMWIEVMLTGVKPSPLFRSFPNFKIKMKNRFVFLNIKASR